MHCAVYRVLCFVFFVSSLCIPLISTLQRTDCKVYCIVYYTVSGSVYSTGRRVHCAVHSSVNSVVHCALRCVLCCVLHCTVVCMLHCALYCALHRVLYCMLCSKMAARSGPRRLMLGLALLPPGRAMHGFDLMYRAHTPAHTRSASVKCLVSSL